MSFTPAACPPAFRPLKLIVPPLNTLAFASLPRWARRMYGTPGSPLTDVARHGRPAHGAPVHDPRRRAQLLYAARRAARPAPAARTASAWAAAASRGRARSRTLITG